jgi:hypothetical protein
LSQISFWSCPWTVQGSVPESEPFCPGTCTSICTDFCNALSGLMCCFVPGYGPRFVPSCIHGSGTVIPRSGQVSLILFKQSMDLQQRLLFDRANAGKPVTRDVA